MDTYVIHSRCLPSLPERPERSRLLLNGLKVSYLKFTSFRHLSQIIFGMSLAAGMRIGLLLGAGDSEQARIASRVALCCNCQCFTYHFEMKKRHFLRFIQTHRQRFLKSCRTLKSISPFFFFSNHCLCNSHLVCFSKGLYPKDIQQRCVSYCLKSI